MESTREIFIQCNIKDDNSLNMFIKHISNKEQYNNKNTYILEAYKLVSIGFASRLAIGNIKKMNKLNLFFNGISRLEELYPDDLEIVFLKYLILRNVPKELGFSNSIIEDEYKLLKNIEFFKSLGDHYYNFTKKTLVS